MHYTVAMIPLDINDVEGDQTIECSACGPLTVAAKDDAAAYALAHLADHGVDVTGPVTGPTR